MPDNTCAIESRQSLIREGPGTVGKRVLLIGMPVWVIDQPPLHLAYVAGLFRHAGWECDIADHNIELFRHVEDTDRQALERFGMEAHLWASQEPRELLRKYEPYLHSLLRTSLEREHYDLVAFSVKSPGLDFSLDACAFVKSVRPKIPVLFGGVPCYPINSGRNFLDESSGPDIICQGEAEIALPRFLKEFEATGSYRTTVQGFAFRDGPAIVDNGEPELPALRDGNVLPDWSRLDLRRYGSLGRLPVITSRGCINHCTFCNECVAMKKYRYRRAADIVAEMQYAVGFVDGLTDRPHFHIVDSLLNGHARELEALCDLIIQSGLRISWSGMAKFRPEMTRTLLENMRLSGCEKLSWGLESASQSVIDLMRKRYTLPCARQILRDTSELGIRSECMLIVGFPGETLLDFIKTLLFVLEFGTSTRFLRPNLALIMHGSALHRDHVKWGLVNGHSVDEWETADGRNTPDFRRLRGCVLSIAVNFSLFFQNNLPWSPDEMWLDQRFNLWHRDDFLPPIDCNSPPVASEARRPDL